MSRTFRAGLVFLALFSFGVTAEGQIWLDYIEVTSTNISGTPSTSTNDTQEKDYAVGDFDLDGDIDLVVARKQPFTTSGSRPNVLFMNVDGVLTDMTTTYAPAFITAPNFPAGDNARDVMVGNFNGDIWPDLVFANAGNQSSVGQQPRIYINLGEDGGGNWLGFSEEPGRLPFLGTPSLQPNACAVGVGDITGNGVDDIYLVDYQNTLEDKLLVNNGSGFFTEETDLRLPNGFENSAFATAGMITDLNGDGWPEIIKNSTPSITVAYNNPGNPGFFNVQQSLSVAAAYHFDVGDLNNDNRQDMFIVQDLQDRFLLNNSSPGAIPVSWQIVNITNSPLTGGFGGNVHIADLDNDGDQDVVVADTDTDVPSCSRRMAFLRNNGSQPTPGITDPYPAGQWIPAHHTGTYDVALADFNNDGVLDMWVGHCSGTDLYYSNVPVAIEPVSNLSCAQVVLNVQMSWTNNDAYTSIEVRRNGVTIASLGGAVTTFTDVNPGSGSYSYTVFGKIGAQSAPPVACVVQVSTVNPVTNFTCSQVDADVALEWTNNGGVGGGSYNAIVIERNGANIAILSGTATSYVDVTAPTGVLGYEITALLGPDTSAPANCTLTVIDTNVTDLVIKFTDTDNGLTPSAEDITQAIADLQIGVVMLEVGNLTELAGQGVSLGSFARVWCELGTFPNNHMLTNTEGQLLADYILAGGNVYAGGADTNCFDPDTPFHALTGIGNCSDGTTGLDNVEGLLAPICGLGDFVLNYSYNGESASIDRLQPLTTGQAILQAETPGGVQFNAGVINMVGVSAVISQSVELGGIGFPNDKKDLVDRYINCFPTPPVGTPFIRGDANADNSLDVADVITTLDHLFSGVPADDCVSALDSNDDGGVNVADAVYTLEFLFGGGANPPSPFPACGVDPTADALECATYPCP